MANINLGRVVPKFVGDFNQEQRYTELDIVQYGGSSYVAKEEVQGEVPGNSNKWQLVAKKGDAGEDGADGESDTVGSGHRALARAFRQHELNLRKKALSNLEGKLGEEGYTISGTTIGRTYQLTGEETEILFTDGLTKPYVTIPNATASSGGLLSAKDKRKLDGLSRNSKATSTADGLMSKEMYKQLDNTKNILFRGLRTGHWLIVGEVKNTPWELEDIEIKVFFEQGQKFDSVTLRAGGNRQFIDIVQLDRLSSGSKLFDKAAIVRSSNDKSKFDVKIMVRCGQLPPKNILDRASVNTVQIRSLYGGVYNCTARWQPDGPEHSSLGKDKFIIDLYDEDEAKGGANIPLATDARNGLLDKDDKRKLDKINIDAILSSNEYNDLVQSGQQRGEFSVKKGDFICIGSLFEFQQVKIYGNLYEGDPQGANLGFQYLDMELINYGSPNIYRRCWPMVNRNYVEGKALFDGIAYANGTCLRVANDGYVRFTMKQTVNGSSHLDKPFKQVHFQPASSDIHDLPVSNK